MGKGRILVTGGAGYIGSHTIIDLLNKGYSELVSIDSYLNSDPETYRRIQEITGIMPRHEKVDLCNPDETLAFFNKSEPFEGVIHFAALKSVPESFKAPELYVENNVTGLQNLLEGLKQNGPCSLIFSSSCSVYGNSKELPVTEETPFGKSESPYGETKQEGESLINAFVGSHPGYKACHLRYFNPVGAYPGGKIGEIQKRGLTNLFPLMMAAAKGEIPALKITGCDFPTPDGTCIRDYIHVCDIARAHRLGLEWLMQQKPGTTEAINLGSGKGYSVREIVNAFIAQSGIRITTEEAPPRPGDVAAIYADISKATRVLGWEPEFGLKEMISTAWEWEKNRH
jgi:UDP-glucose 4-epimerase